MNEIWDIYPRVKISCKIKIPTVKNGLQLVSGSNCSWNALECFSGDCYPFRCKTDKLTTVYVPTTYISQTDTFCDKSVTIAKTLQIE